MKGLKVSLLHCLANNEPRLDNVLFYYMEFPSHVLTTSNVMNLHEFWQLPTTLVNLHRNATEPTSHSNYISSNAFLLKLIEDKRLRQVNISHTPLSLDKDY